MNMNTEIEWLPLADVLRGGLNPRTHFDPEKIQELVTSFKEHGFTPALSHLLVRPHPAAPEKWELICGERRWRAATELGMEKVPAVVEAMSDVRVMELQLVENLQRDGLSPLEEAMGFRALLTIEEGGKRSHSVKSLAAKIGRTEMSIRHRLSLIRLVGTMAGEALEAGELPISHAYLLARVQSDKLRDDFTRRVLKPADGLAPIPFRQLEWMIRDEGMVELRGADFDVTDVVLVPVRMDGDVRVMGGACSDCPHNTKNGEHAGGAKFHMCMNPECFREKRAAAHAGWMASVSDPEKGRTALSFAEAENVFDISGKKLAHNSGLVDLDEPPPEHDLNRGVSDPPDWKKLIRGQGVPVLVAKDGDGRVRELVDHKLALAAARENERDKPERIFRLAMADGKEAVPGWKKEELAEKDLESRAALKLREKAARELAERIEEAQFLAIIDRARGVKVPEEFWALAVDSLLAVTEEHGDAGPVAARHGLEGVDALTKYARKLLVADRVAFAVELLLTLYVREMRVVVFPAWSKAFGVDLKVVKKSVADQVAAEQKASADKAEIAEGIVWKTRKEKVDDFEWNAAGVCVNPDVALLQFPKGAKIFATVEVARAEKGWKVGFETNASKSGSRLACNLQTPSYSSRSLALKTGLLGLKPLLKAADAPGAVLKRVEEFIAAISDSGKNIGKVKSEPGKKKFVPETIGVINSAPDVSKLKGLSAEIVRVMTAAGPEGMKVKDVAVTLSMTPGQISVWFSTTGKNLARKIAPGHYSVFPEVKVPVKAEKAEAGPVDKMFQEAVALRAADPKGFSAAMLQRHFRLGYRAAVDLLDRVIDSAAEGCLTMIKRPLNARFSAAVREGKKFTTIREKP